MAYITIQIPPNAEPGVDSLTFQYRGQELEILVPSDATVGDVLQIQVGGDDDVDNEVDANDDVVDVGNSKQKAEANGSSLLTELGGIEEVDSQHERNIHIQENTTVSLGNSIAIHLQQSTHNTQKQGDGTNAMVWPSGLVLAQSFMCPSGIEYITKHASTQPSINCLDLGSGLGLCGISFANALSKCNVDKKKVVMTDLGDDGVELLNANIYKNSEVFHNVIVEAASLPWGKTLEGMENKFHFILGSDLLYNTNESYEPLLVTMLHHLHPEGRIILAVRWRKPDLEKDFFVKAQSFGIEFELWTEVLDTSEFQSRCTCRLGWNEYGNVECDAFKKFISETDVLIRNEKKNLAEVTESDMENMTDDEHSKFEECQIQIYIGSLNKKVATKKRSIHDIS